MKRKGLVKKAVLPALVALVLGIIDWVKKHKAGAPKGKAIAGTICAALALIIIPISYIVVAAIGASTIEDYDYDYDDDEYYDDEEDEDFDIDKLNDDIEKILNDEL